MTSTERSRERSKRWQAQNPEKRLQQLRKYQENNKEKIVQRATTWNAQHPERHKQHIYKYRAKNIEKCRQWNRASYHRNKEKRKLQAKLWRKENKQLATTRDRKNALRGRYGISVEDYDLLFKAQSGLCAICKGEPTLTRNLCVDHRHSDKKVRGLLCYHCNFVIGNARDNCDTLRAAIAYLEKYNQ